MKITELITSFRSYLVHVEGASEESASKYCGNVLIICRELDIESIDQLKANDINKKWLADFWKMMVERRGIKTNTVISYQTALKKFVKFLEENKIIPTGTSEQITLAKPETVHLNGLSFEERKMLRNFLSSNLGTDRERRDAALVYFLMVSGVRISEALRCDVHGDSIIYTTAGVRSGDFYVDDGDIYVHIKGKGHRERDIPVDPLAVSYINLYLEQREVKSSTLFLNCARWTKAERITRGGAYHAICQLFDRADIEVRGLKTHVFRHTAIEKWIKEGKFTIKQILSMTGMKDENSLEHYFRRSKDLTRPFIKEGSVARDIPVPKDIAQFEDILFRKYYNK